MKIIFMGTPDFSVPSLKEIDDHFGVELVVTQPDKQKGRGKKVQFSPVKEEALKRNIRVIQPVKLRTDREAIEEIRSLAPDFIVVVAYGQILSEEVLSIPKYGCINLHASLLPLLRGAAPLNFALIEGHEESGSTTMLMDKGIDTGDMLLTDRVVLDDKMNVETLHDLLSSRGGKLLLDSMKGLADGSIIPTKQNHEKSTHAPLITKETCEIDWTKSAREIHNLVRGLSPVPGAYSYIEDDKVKILETMVVEEKSDEPGTIMEVSPNGVLVSTGDGLIQILKLQYPGKKPMSVRDFLNGNEITAKKFKRSVE